MTPKGDPNGRPHPMVWESCRYVEKIRGMLSYAERTCLRFFIDAGLVEIEDAKTGSTDNREKVKIKRCFNVYFDKWDIPNTHTTDSGKTYIWNLKGE